MSPLFFVIFFLAAVGYANGASTCGTDGDGTCYFINDPCPKGMEDCSDKYECELDTNKCCCPVKPDPREVCGSGNVQDTCFFTGDDCPSGREDCAAKYYCPVDTNKCCCV